MYLNKKMIRILLTKCSNSWSVCSCGL